MLTRVDKCPWPYFGGKSDAAPAVWEALGDVEHFVDPTCGSLAVLLLRPHPCNRPYYSETVNDKDGFLCNAWRSIQLSPKATAEQASWPVCEADLHARHLALLKWAADRDLERLMGDPEYHDPKIAGWWIWGQSCWIGSGFASGRGAWVVGADGRITKRKGVDAGVARQLPHVSSNGAGVNHPCARDPGVARQLPHVGDDGKGVNRPLAREPGVSDIAVEQFHPVTMPEVRRWFAFLAARIRHVRILNGDHKRALTDGVGKTLSVRQGGTVGYFLDPPYRTTDSRTANLYTHDAGDDISSEIREWCKKNGEDPKKRIVLAGYSGEGHEELEALGWRCVEWFKSGFMKGGMAQTARRDEADEDGTASHQQHRERLWLSPHCLRPEPPKADRQMSWL